MPYNPNLYMPYGQQSYPQPMSAPMTIAQPNWVYQPTQTTTGNISQPVEGLTWIDSIEGAIMYPLPPNSVSPPLMLRNEPAFIIKTTDGGGAATYQKGKFELEPLQMTQPSDTITRADLESFKKEMMEAINGKPPAPQPQQPTG